MVLFALLFINLSIAFPLAFTPPPPQLLTIAADQDSVVTTFTVGVPSWASSPSPASFLLLSHISCSSESETPADCGAACFLGEPADKAQVVSVACRRYGTRGNVTAQVRLLVLGHGWSVQRWPLVSNVTVEVDSIEGELDCVRDGCRLGLGTPVASNRSFVLPSFAFESTSAYDENQWPVAELVQGGDEVRVRGWRRGLAYLQVVQAPAAAVAVRHSYNVMPLFAAQLELEDVLPDDANVSNVWFIVQSADDGYINEYNAERDDCCMGERSIRLAVDEPPSQRVRAVRGRSGASSGDPFDGRVAVFVQAVHFRDEGLVRMHTPVDPLPFPSGTAEAAWTPTLSRADDRTIVAGHVSSSTVDTESASTNALHFIPTWNGSSVVVRRDATAIDETAAWLQLLDVAVTQAPPTPSPPTLSPGVGDDNDMSGNDTESLVNGTGNDGDGGDDDDDDDASGGVSVGVVVVLVLAVLLCGLVAGVLITRRTRAATAPAVPPKKQPVRLHRRGGKGKDGPPEDHPDARLSELERQLAVTQRSHHSSGTVTRGSHSDGPRRSRPTSMRLTIDPSHPPPGTGTFRPQTGRIDPVVPGYAQLPPVFGRQGHVPRSGHSTPGSRSRKRTQTTDTMPYVNIDMLSEQMKRGRQGASSEYDIVEALTLTQRSVGDYDVVAGGSRRSSAKYDTVQVPLE
uniref:Uncharacterized protein n=1 Tax=Sexangularia sp. CB-2014 TaxID=1486929 RepID=A0A7S1VPG8_9EUKA|mmetsp:Transcript_6452/g.20906  ORF Transcript_6452/g.20906 Transcript_6452/m.20906 type:complete len:684 (+) Transcript_6452:61-2112(+)